MSPLPGAWRGASVWGNLSSDPTESEPVCTRDVGAGAGAGAEEGCWGGGGPGGSLPLTVHQNPQRCPSRSAGLTFICLIPEAIRQFSWETAAKIYICLSVST